MITFFQMCQKASLSDNL